MDFSFNKGQEEIAQFTEINTILMEIPIETIEIHFKRVRFGPEGMYCVEVYGSFALMHDTIESVHIGLGDSREFEDSGFAI